MIDTAATIIIKIMMPIIPKYLAMFPNTTPTTKKSVSENVVAAPPNSPKNGRNKSGKKVIKRPFNAEPATAVSYTHLRAHET